MRPSDTVARVGGDEFVVLVEDTDEESLGQLADRLRASVTEPLALSGDVVDVGVSVGVALTRGGQDDLATLLGRADRDMYAEKRGTRRSVGRAGGATRRTGG